MYRFSFLMSAAAVQAGSPRYLYEQMSPRSRLGRGRWPPGKLGPGQRPLHIWTGVSLPVSRLYSSYSAQRCPITSDDATSTNEAPVPDQHGIPPRLGRQRARMGSLQIEGPKALRLLSDAVGRPCDQATPYASADRGPRCTRRIPPLASASFVVNAGDSHCVRHGQGRLGRIPEHRGPAPRANPTGRRRHRPQGPSYQELPRPDQIPQPSPFLCTLHAMAPV